MANKWDVKWDRKAEEFINNQTPKDQRLIYHTIEELLNSDNPYSHPAVEKLVEDRYSDCRRARQGDFRIIFCCDAQATIKVYKGTLYISEVCRRSSVYKKK